MSSQFRPVEVLDNFHEWWLSITLIKLEGWRCLGFFFFHFLFYLPHYCCGRSCIFVDEWAHKCSKLDLWSVFWSLKFCLVLFIFTANFLRRHFWKKLVFLFENQGTNLTTRSLFDICIWIEKYISFWVFFFLWKVVFREPVFPFFNARSSEVPFLNARLQKCLFESDTFSRFASSMWYFQNVPH